jgi:small subunit ribosomal protein S16
MLVIRFLRAGKKNQPFFKIVVVEKEKTSTSGFFTEEVGFYNPLTKEKNLKGDRIKYWISVGAKPSPTVHNLLISEKIFAELRSSHALAKVSAIEGNKIPVHAKSKKEKDNPSEENLPKEEPKKIDGLTEAAEPVKTENKLEEKPAESDKKIEAAEKPTEKTVKKLEEK